MKLCLVKVVIMFIITSYKGLAGADVPGDMCIYPVSHDREAPQWELFRVDDDFLREDNATKETCWGYCNKAENCKSAQHIIHGDGRHYCYRYNISVQELKDTWRYKEIFTQTNRDEYPTYITYDRDCAECPYPVSHAWEYPVWYRYFIAEEIFNIPTLKSCQDWCNEDVKCRSVTVIIWGHSRKCEKYRISLQELKDSGRYNHIYHSSTHSITTYDKQCAAPPSIMCFNTYPVSHEGEEPDVDMYLIYRKYKNIPTIKSCQDWCTEDVRCKSVSIWMEHTPRMCIKFSISVQELKDSGRYNEIKNWGIRSEITYDKQCVDHTKIECSNTYPVSHDREAPDWGRYGGRYGMDQKRDDNFTLKTCQDWCNENATCRSVMYKIHRDGRRWCAKFTIKVQELKEMRKYRLIYTETDTDEYPTYITYDRNCVEVSPTTKGPGTDGDEVSPGTNAAAIGEPMIVLILMIGAGAVFVAPMLPGAEIAF